ncbi:hypothetical protein GCM10023097_57470 [Streptomyces collinus]
MWHPGPADVTARRAGPRQTHIRKHVSGERAHHYRIGGSAGQLSQSQPRRQPIQDASPELWRR